MLDGFDRGAHDSTGSAPRAPYNREGTSSPSQAASLHAAFPGGSPAGVSSSDRERWYSALELAGMPGLPTTKRGVNDLATRDAWPFRDRAGRGGGREYPLSILPVETRTHIAAQIASQAAGARRAAGMRLALASRLTAEARFARSEEALKASARQPERAQQRIDAKLAVLRAWEHFHTSSELPVAASQHAFARLYNRAEIAVEDWVRELVPECSGSTLQRWRSTLSRGGVADLAGRYGNRRGDTAIDRQRELYDFVVAMLTQHPHASASHVQQALQARFRGTSVRLPSPRALQRWLSAWKQENAQLYTAIANPDAWKGRYMAAQGSLTEGVTRLNQRWELDSTPGDVMLIDGRHAVIGVIDVYSRRAKLLVSKTSKSVAIATLVRHALLDWGVPEEAKTDNGQDYTSHHLTRAFAALGIQQSLCPPFSPWKKPSIERFFGTFSRDLVELLPGFIGHSVAERQAIEARSSFADRLLKRDGTLEVSLTAAEFQRFCDSWCEDVYMHRDHRGLDGATPFDRVTQWRHPVRRIEDPRALDVLLAEAPGDGTRTVQKKGIQVDGGWFIGVELGEHVGRQVQVRLDPADLGRIYVFSAQSGAFIGVAECPERTGMDRREVAIKAREVQRAKVQDERRALKAAAKRLGTTELVNEILAERAEAAGKLARLPAPSVVHETPDIAAATDAVLSLEAPRETVISDELAKTMAEVEAQLAQPAQVLEVDTDKRRFERWLRVQRRLDAGERLAEDELRRHRGYMESAEWSAMKTMYDAFGEDALTG